MSEQNHTERDGSIRWMSDGPVLKLANGDWVRPVIEDIDTKQKCHANTVSPVDKCAMYGPDAGDDKAALWFEDVERMGDGVVTLGKVSREDTDAE